MKPKAHVIFHRDPDLAGIDICRVAKSGHAFPEHFHDSFYILGLIEAGACYCLGSRQTDAVARPGGVTLLNPGQLHSGVPVDNGTLTYTMGHISLGAMNAMVLDLDPGWHPAPEFTRPIVHDKRLSALFRQLFHALIYGKDSLAKEALMVAAFHFLVSRYGRQGQPRNRQSTARHQPVTRARELLAQELDKKLTLEKVAQSVGLSQYHFLRTFKRETGLSPHHFRTLKRVEAARDLLGRGMPQAQVALETGFSDQAHFANTFRRWLGATPGQYLSMRLS